MSPYTQKLLSAIAAYEAKCGITAPESILESLWFDYACANPVDDGPVRAAEAKLAPVYAELSMKTSDTLSDVILDLLTAYQRAAYLEGFRTGVHLLQELA